MTIELRVRFERWYQNTHTSANLSRSAKGYNDNTTRVAWRAYQEGAISQGRSPVHTADWFNDTFAEMSITPQIRGFSERVCREFNICGICDPAYIGNLVATVFDVGDGRGNFTGAVIMPTQQSIEKLFSRLSFAYSSSIPADSSALRRIIQECFVNTQASKTGALSAFEV